MRHSRKASLFLVAMLLVVGCGPAEPTIGPDLNLPDPGAVWFGTAVDSSSMTMGTHASSFSAKTAFGWMALFSSFPNATTITLTIEAAGTGGSEVTVLTMPVAWPNSLEQQLAHDPDTSVAAYGPGTYTVRYTTGTIVLATGTVTVTP